MAYGPTHDRQGAPARCSAFLQSPPKIAARLSLRGSLSPWREEIHMLGEASNESSKSLGSLKVNSAVELIT